MPYIFGDLDRPTTHEPTHQTLHCRPVSYHLAGHRIESLAFTFSHRIRLHVVSDRKERRKRIRQIQQERGGYDADEAKVVGDRRRDDKGDDPPDGYDGGVEYFAAAVDEGWRVEDVHEDVVVEHFDADVAVQSGGDEGGNEGDHVAGCLPAVDGDALIAYSKRWKNINIYICFSSRERERWRGCKGSRCQMIMCEAVLQDDLDLRVRILPLEMIDVAPINQIHGINEELRSPHGFEKVLRPSHLCQELYEELRPGVGKHAGQQAVNGPHEVGSRETPIVDDRWVVALRVWCYRVWVNDRAC